MRPVEFNFEFKPDFADAQAETTKSFGQGTMIPEAVFPSTGERNKEEVFSLLAEINDNLAKKNDPIDGCKNYEFYHLCT